MDIAIKLTRSFRHAFRGLVLVAREERNFAIETVAACVVLAVAVVLRVSNVEAALLALVTGGVLVLELLNSATERVVDLVKPRLHPYVAEVKDITAAAVLVASVAAAIVGAFIFWPYLVSSFAGAPNTERAQSVTVDSVPSGLSR
jgi:diacylglycerol kinase